MGCVSQERRINRWRPELGKQPPNNTYNLLRLSQKNQYVFGLYALHHFVDKDPSSCAGRQISRIIKSLVNDHLSLSVLLLGPTIHKYKGALLKPRPNRDQRTLLMPFKPDRQIQKVDIQKNNNTCSIMETEEKRTEQKRKQGSAGGSSNE